MEEKKFKEIMEEDGGISWKGDNALKGLNIIASYFDKNTTILGWAGHDIISSVNIDKIVDVITEEDAIKLRNLNWMIQDDCLSCFV